MVIDTMSFTVTAPGAAGALAAPVLGDAAIIRNGLPGRSIMLLAAWTNAQAAGFTQITWPSGHDLLRGLRYRNLQFGTSNKLSHFFPGQFRGQDPIVVTQAGSAVAGDVETVHMLTFYEVLPGVEGRYINLATLRQRGVNVVTYEDTTTATAAGAYSGPRFIGQSANTFKANTDYAVLGAMVASNCGVLTIRGVDTGNLRVGIPGATTAPILDEQINWFVGLSEFLDLPTIPVINSANFPGTLVENVTNENLAAVLFSLNLVELAPSQAAAKAAETLQEAAPAS